MMQLNQSANCFTKKSISHIVCIFRPWSNYYLNEIAIYYDIW